MSLGSVVSAATPASTSSAGYDVILLVGQSNMEGYGSGPDDAGDAAVSPLIFAWDPISNSIIPAADPLYHWDGLSAYVGPGLTFAKAYLAKIAASGRKVLLVGAAAPGTSIASGFWSAPAGSGPTTAVAYANAAIKAAGAGAKLVGIVWDQGESDVEQNGGPTYQASLKALLAYFKANITGASSTTPFVVGEFTYNWVGSNIATNAVYAAQQYTILNDFHALPDVVPYTAWTSAAWLPSDVLNGLVHFSALSQREYGRRFADRFFEAMSDLPQPQLSLKSWQGEAYDDGRGLLSLSTAPFNIAPMATGTVTPAIDQVRGEVQQISAAGGFLTSTVPGGTFNGSYTKMAWFLPGTAGYFNNLISASNPGQAHFLVAEPVSATSLYLAAGHTSGASTPAVSATVTVTPGAWLQLAVVYNATAKTMTLYVNGVSVASAKNVAPAPVPTGAPATLPVHLGNFTGIASQAGGGVDGEMAGNRVWTTALSSTQIAAIYKYEATGTAQSPGYGVVASAPTLTLPRSTTATETVTIVPNNGFNGTVSLSISGTSSRSVTAAVTAGAVAGTYTVTLTAPPTAAPGVYPLVVTGTSGSKTIETPLTVTVQ